MESLLKLPYPPTPMKRLPALAATLLLLVVAWLCMKSQENEAHSPRLQTSQAINPSISAPNNHENSQDKSSKPALFPQTSRGIPITAEFVRSLARGAKNVIFPLPDGRDVHGTIEQHHQAADGSPVGASGRLTAPGKGTFHFRTQPAGFPAGPVIGAVVIEGAEIAFQVMPGPAQTSLLAARPIDQVICRNYTLPPQDADGPEEIIADHPTDIETPLYQNGIIPLQSRPSAEGVIYLDFDGASGPQEGWGDFEAAAPSGMTPTKVMNIWARVSEDFAPFNLNVTTDLQVFLNAPETSRQRCIITPTKNAAPNAGGVAYMGSFGWSGDTPCWCFYSSSSKYAAEIISHEIGHTLGLYHDGRISAESYYLGHGSDLVGWAPIMGAGYYKNLTQWSKGEYNSANELQDDIAIIAANPGVGLIADDAGDSHVSAAALEVYSNGTIKSEGNIGAPSDVDAFSFTTTGGAVALTISPVANGQNLDVFAGIDDSLGNPVISDNPDLALNATLSTTLLAGTYSVRVKGSARGNSLTDGYSDYGSLGQYTITGTITGAVAPDRFTIAENSPVETIVGTPTLRNNHAGSALTYQIMKGNTNSTFKMSPKTGLITVAKSSFLDFEKLSTGWDDPANFDLTVEVKDLTSPGLSESLRIVITVQDLYEPLPEPTHSLTIASAETLTVPQSNTSFQSLTNDGTLVVSSPLQITGNATNNGVLRLFGDSILNVTGTFTNSGVIDIINWNGTLPPSMINTGIILDRTAHRVLATATHSSQFHLSVPGFAGHLYQLESSDELTGPWTPLGDSLVGTGEAENPPLLQFTPDMDGPRRFYRVAVVPAP